MYASLKNNVSKDKLLDKYNLLKGSISDELCHDDQEYKKHFDNIWAKIYLFTDLHYLFNEIPDKYIRVNIIIRTISTNTRQTIYEFNHLLKTLNYEHLMNYAHFWRSVLTSKNIYYETYVALHNIFSSNHIYDLFPKSEKINLSYDFIKYIINYNVRIDITKINIYNSSIPDLTMEFSYYLIMINKDVFDNYKLIPVEDNRLSEDEIEYLSIIQFAYKDFWIMTHLIPFSSHMILFWIKVNSHSFSSTLNEGIIKFIIDRLTDIDHLDFLDYMIHNMGYSNNRAVPIFMEKYKDKLIMNEKIIEPIIKRKNTIIFPVLHEIIKLYIEICVLHSTKIKVPLLRKLLWRTRNKTETSIVILKYINDNDIKFRFDTVDKSFLEKYSNEIILEFVVNNTTLECNKIIDEHFKIKDKNRSYTNTRDTPHHKLNESEISLLKHNINCIDMDKLDDPKYCYSYFKNEILELKFKSRKPKRV